ncbi:hypothetical protein FHS87_004539 [Roseomonas pecuniae]|uniref:Uncharacterized protein n=1 Tax=Muricoccus pecuniae TaxID=693023 RepID=A0A840Y5P1_9PROT|nr:hypothetical protein [Roseomonas pecuniae]
MTLELETHSQQQPIDCDDIDAFGLRFIEPAPTTAGGTTTTKTVSVPWDTDPEDSDM